MSMKTASRCAGWGGRATGGKQVQVCSLGMSVGVRTGHKSPDWPHPMGAFTGLGAAQKEVQSDSICAPSGPTHKLEVWGAMKSGPKRWHALDFGDMERRGCGVDQTQPLVTVRARHDGHLVRSFPPMWSRADFGAVTKWCLAQLSKFRAAMFCGVFCRSTTLNNVIRSTG